MGHPFPNLCCKENYAKPIDICSQKYTNNKYLNQRYVLRPLTFGALKLKLFLFVKLKHSNSLITKSNYRSLKFLISYSQYI